MLTDSLSHFGAFQTDPIITLLSNNTTEEDSSNIFGGGGTGHYHSNSGSTGGGAISPSATTIDFSSDGTVVAWQTNASITTLVTGLAAEEQSNKENEIRMVHSSPVSTLCFAPPHELKKTTSFSSTNGGTASSSSFIAKYVLATGHENGNIKLWDASTAKLITTLLSHTLAITGFCFGLDSKLTLISVSHDCYLKVNKSCNILEKINQHWDWMLSGLEG